MTTKIAVPDLEYGGKLMTAEPSSRLSLTQVKNLLNEGFGCWVRLEPGDGTRYELIISPVWGAAFAFLGPRDNEDYKYLYVTLVGPGPGRFGQGKLIRRDQRPFDWLDLTRNEWTTTFLSWWFMKLWAEMGYQHPILLDSQFSEPEA